MPLTPKLHECFVMNVVNSEGKLGEASPTQTNAQNTEKLKKGASSLTFVNAIAPGCLLAYF